MPSLVYLMALAQAKITTSCHIILFSVVLLAPVAGTSELRIVAIASSFCYDFRRLNRPFTHGTQTPIIVEHHPHISFPPPPAPFHLPKALCDVCAPSFSMVLSTCARVLGDDPRIVSIEPGVSDATDRVDTRVCHRVAICNLNLVRLLRDNGVGVWDLLLDKVASNTADPGWRYSWCMWRSKRF